MILSGNMSTPESGTLLIYSSINGSSAQQIGTTPLINGAYSYSYNITAPGTYAIYVDIPANGQQSEVRSSIVNMTTQRPPIRESGIQYINVGAPGYAVYIIIAIVLAIAAIGGAVALRRRAASAAARKAIKQPTTVPLPP